MNRRSFLEAIAAGFAAIIIIPDWFKPKRRGPEPPHPQPGPGPKPRPGNPPKKRP